MTRYEHLPDHIVLLLVWYQNLQEAQLMLTTGSRRLVVNQGQQT